jgi:hypothetical protein
MSEREFIDKIEDYPDWEKGGWRPWRNDCHNKLEGAFEFAGASYPGAPNGRIDLDDNFAEWTGLDHVYQLLSTPWG